VTQLSIFEAHSARRSALSRVESHADREWLDRAFAALRGYLERNQTFFCDQMWGLIEKPREARALGPVMVRAAKAGLMSKTGEYRLSVSSNLSPKPLWRSLVYRGTQP
jgi:hypothetical protein